MCHDSKKVEKHWSNEPKSTETETLCLLAAAEIVSIKVLSRVSGSAFWLQCEPSSTCIYTRTKLSIPDSQNIPTGHPRACCLLPVQNKELRRVIPLRGDSHPSYPAVYSGSGICENISRTGVSPITNHRWYTRTGGFLMGGAIMHRLIHPFRIYTFCLEVIFDRLLFQL